MARWMSTINENVSGLGWRNGYCKYSNLADCPHEISAGGSCVLRKLNVFTRQTGCSSIQPIVHNTFIGFIHNKSGLF